MEASANPAVEDPPDDDRALRRELLLTTPQTIRRVRQVLDLRDDPHQTR
jgi:hypothetical protein